MYVKLYNKEIPGKGMGVFASNLIPEGTLIWKLSNSRKLSKEEYNNSPENIKKDAYPENDHYVLALGDGESWNHSCDANTWWTADDELSARRDIRANEEITYDYATTDIDPNIQYTWDCKCGSSNCRQKLHWNHILKPEIYNVYKGHLPTWVEVFVKKNSFKNILAC